LWIDSEFLARILKENSTKKLNILISILDLDIEGENLLLNLNGELFPISSLQKVGNQWLAEYQNYDARYCIRGHNLSKCGNCHVKGCPVYADPRHIHGQN
jgi:hypothetical protein